MKPILEITKNNKIKEFDKLLSDTLFEEFMRTKFETKVDLSQNLKVLLEQLGMKWFDTFYQKDNFKFYGYKLKKKDCIKIICSVLGHPQIKKVRFNYKSPLQFNRNYNYISIHFYTDLK